MDYLAGLARHLPEGQRKRFDESDIRLRMQHIRDRLTGQAGLKARAESRVKAETARVGASSRATGIPEIKVTSSRLAGTLRFLKGLAGLLPDRQVGSSLDDKVDSVIVQIEDKET
jgi:hypothetical protein